METKVKGKGTVLVTGASAGIGKATAEVFAEQGYDLVLAARRLDRLEEMKKELEARHGVSVAVLEADLSKLESAEVLHGEIGRRGLTIDILVNNAGFGTSGKFVEIDLDRETEMLMLNMVTLTKLTKLFARDMAARKSGHIVNIASTAAFQPIPGFAAYAATKAYVLNFSEALGAELEGEGVRVTAICPGATVSEFGKIAGLEKAGMFAGAPSSRQLGEFVYRSVIAGKSVAIHGWMNALMARGSKFIPKKTVMAVASKLTR